ncbi:MAG: hypothetical protein KatS3mg003_1076 [Candidatus Nitrosocaldaceae archaeon]|nr:MAG: hypothetical protein KatS3mg003_1076 [Candidatus Nitrosocaldaceae archaeon]
MNEYNLFILNFEKDFSKIKDKIKKGVRLNYNTYRKFKIIDKKYQYNASLITRKGIHINNVEDIIVEVKPIALELIEVAPNIKT